MSAVDTQISQVPVSSFVTVAQCYWGMQDQVVILANQCIMKLRAPGFAQVHRIAENDVSPTSLMEVPPAEVRWAIPWQSHPHCCLTKHTPAGPALQLASKFVWAGPKLQQCLHTCCKSRVWLIQGLCKLLLNTVLLQ